MTEPATCTLSVVAAPRHMRVAPLYEDIASYSVDLEMFYASRVLQSMEIVTEVQNYTADVTARLLRRFPRLDGVRETLRSKSSRLCSWLQQKLGDDGTLFTRQDLLPLPQLIEFQLTPQHMTFITENFVDIKTQLQLMHATLDDLEQKGERVDKNLKRLDELLGKDIPCRYEPQDRCTCSKIAATALSLSHTNKSKSRRSGAQFCETLMLHVNRLDVPM